MPEDDWIWLKLAWLGLAARFGAHGAELRLQRAWEEGALTLRGIASTIPETRQVVEIPASEAGRLWLHCPRSQLRRGSGRRWLADYHSVQVRKADVERLAQEARTPGSQPSRVSSAVDAGGRDADAAVVPTVAIDVVNTPVSEAPPEQPPQTVASVAKTLAPKASALVRAVAHALRKKWPDGRPQKTVYQILESLHADYPKTKIGACGETTLERAIHYLKEQGQPGWQSIKPRLD
jgi:hypothetical protein